MQTISYPGAGFHHLRISVGWQLAGRQISITPVEVAGVDVLHPARDRLAQHDQCRVMVLGRHAGACELHGTVTKERAPTEADAPS